MTTSEFIKMLQEADPEGNAHIRMEGGIPVFAEHKAGYWDGPYSYIDEDGNYVYSTKGSKIDLHCRDIDGFVEHHFDLHDPDNWDNIKKMFKFELTYSFPEQRKEREDRILKIAKEAWDEEYEMEKRFFDENIKRNSDNAKDGWTWFQNKEVDNKELKPNMHHYYTWKVYDKDEKEQGSNLHNTHGVYKSGLFERLDNNKKPGYYQWVLK